MKDNLRRLAWVVGLAIVVGVAVTGEAPLNGQSRGQGDANSPIPDLRGVWEPSGSVYMFDDVTDTGNTPVFFDLPAGEFMYITQQTGRVFAGSHEESKLTGVILHDGTVSIQFFELTELRGFATGSIGGAQSTEISGFVHFFDDFGFGVDSTMSSGVFKLVKVL